MISVARFGSHPHSSIFAIISSPLIALFYCFDQFNSLFRVMIRFFKLFKTEIIPSFSLITRWHVLRRVHVWDCCIRMNIRTKSKINSWLMQAEWHSGQWPSRLSRNCPSSQHRPDITNFIPKIAILSYSCHNYGCAGTPSRQVALAPPTQTP